MMMLVYMYDITCYTMMSENKKKTKKKLKKKEFATCQFSVFYISHSHWLEQSDGRFLLVCFILFGFFFPYYDTV